MGYYISRLLGSIRKNRIIELFFYSGADQRTLNTRDNVIYSSLYRGISMALGLWMVPLTLNYLDPTEYGIWLTLTSLIAWFNFFDVGLGNGLRNKLAEALAGGDYKLAKGYVSTAFSALTLIAIVLSILFLASYKLIDWYTILNVSESYNEDLRILVLVVFLFFSFRFVFGLILVVLNADQKVSTAAFIDLITGVLSLIGVYVINAIIPDSLLLLGIILSFVPAMVLAFATFWFFRRDYKRIRPSVRCVSVETAKGLTNLSLQFFVLQAVVLLIFFSNNIIIAQLLNPSKVSEFNIAHKYFNIITIASVLILNPFWSAATEAYFKEDFLWLKRSIKHLVSIWLVLSLVAVTMIVLSPFVYKLWIKDALIIPFEASVLMGVYVIILSWHNTFVYIINGIGKIRLQLYIYIVMGLLVVPMSYFFIRVMNMDISGSILSMIICLVPASILMPIQIKKIINKEAAGVFNK